MGESSWLGGGKAGARNPAFLQGLGLRVEWGLLLSLALESCGGGSPTRGPLTSSPCNK